MRSTWPGLIPCSRGGALLDPLDPNANEAELSCGWHPLPPFFLLLVVLMRLRFILFFRRQFVLFSREVLANFFQQLIELPRLILLVDRFLRRERGSQEAEVDAGALLAGPPNSDFPCT